MQVKCVGRCFRRQLITIKSMRRRACRTASGLVPIILMSPVEPCFGIVISVRVSPSIRFFTEPLAPIIAPKNALRKEENWTKFSYLVCAFGIFVMIKTYCGTWMVVLNRFADISMTSKSSWASVSSSSLPYKSVDQMDNILRLNCFPMKICIEFSISIEN